jgi:pimeloyl-ACP methyl ester carboxylesterase
MKHVGCSYQQFREHLGRMSFVGLQWPVTDRLLGEMMAPTRQAWDEACERLADEYAPTQPATAMALYHFAQFLEARDLPRKRRLQRLVRGLFEQVVARSPLRVSPLAVPDGEKTFAAYLVEPPGAGPSGSTMVLVNGLDSLTEVEMWCFAQRFLGEGVGRCVIFDGPGQGQARGERGYVLDRFETVIPAIIATLQQRDGVAVRPILFGVSFAGFLVMRLAQRLSCLEAAVCYCCALNWDHIPQLPGEYRELFQLAAGTPDEASWAQFVREELRLSPHAPPRCPVEIVHGVRDVLMRVEHSRALRDAFPDKVRLREFEDGHVCLHNIEAIIQGTAAWLREVRAL